MFTVCFRSELGRHAPACRESAAAASEGRWTAHRWDWRHDEGTPGCHVYASWTWTPHGPWCARCWRLSRGNISYYLAFIFSSIHCCNIHFSLKLILGSSIPLIFILYWSLIWEHFCLHKLLLLFYFCCFSFQWLLSCRIWNQNQVQLSSSSFGLRSPQFLIQVFLSILDFFPV